MAKKGEKKTHCKRGHPRIPENVDKGNACISCKRAATIAWNKSNPEKVRASTDKWLEKNPDYLSEYRKRNPENQRISKLKSRYGLSLEQIKQIPDTCEVCGRTNGKGTVVDHNHETGKVRGFLCNSCNWILGYAKDNPGTLEKLALYLRERS